MGYIMGLKATPGVQILSQPGLVSRFACSFTHTHTHTHTQQHIRAAAAGWMMRRGGSLSVLPATLVVVGSVVLLVIDLVGVNSWTTSPLHISTTSSTRFQILLLVSRFPLSSSH